ncbi:RNA 2',3'-cyclic phosphodiesterase [candidate division WOR-3 bacterium]|nr:RNA 2',3'-cyclic phosphodiesterase [candidate division WOR-3 bacterium]
MRTFLAVEVPEHIRKKIDDFIQIEAKRELPIKWVKFDNLHITLKFLGEIDEKKKVEITPVIREIGKRYSPFNAQLTGLGCFPNPRNPRVLWLGVKEGSEMLCNIAAEIEKALARFGFKEEKRFHPHLTIGRIKTFCKIDHILEKAITSEPFSVNALTLFKSTLKPDGPIYTALDEFRFS